jgi:hypothetical protein
MAGVIERIVAEVKAYKEAPLHFQRLAIELDFLYKVCHQVFELRPSSAADLAQLERIRAIALHCLGPLKEFETKMGGYESSLGLNLQPKSKSGNLSRFKKRLQWSAITGHEVDELRAILTSELLAINTLLSMQRWYAILLPVFGIYGEMGLLTHNPRNRQGLQSQSSSNERFSAQLTCLMKTTNAAALEIHDFLLGSKATAERLEAAVTSAHAAEMERGQAISAIQQTVAETHGWVNSIGATLGNVSTQLTELFSLTKYLENWIRQIVECCKAIIGQVQQNTGMLLSLHGLVKSLEMTLRRTGIDLPVLELENPFGVRMALPYQLCDTWEVRIICLYNFFANTKIGYMSDASRGFLRQTRAWLSGTPPICHVAGADKSSHQARVLASVGSARR